MQRLAVETDDIASFVQKKPQAVDLDRRGCREPPSDCLSHGEWQPQEYQVTGVKIPQAYCQHATFYTNYYVVYEGVIPVAQHWAINKLVRKTNHIKPFNNTLRQRVSHVVREALSFSKKLVDHISAIKLFLCHYNLTRAAA
jgi:insertion element IS1 protein InsB